MAATLVAGAPLSHRQLTFLRAHILRQKKKEQGVLINLIKAHRVDCLLLHYSFEREVGQKRTVSLEGYKVER